MFGWLLKAAEAVDSIKGPLEERSLAEDGLVFALGAIVAVEAAAETG